jgi:hypothetical protein
VAKAPARPPLERRQAIDPAVADILEQIDRRPSAAPAALGKEEKRREREQAKNDSRRGKRASYDLPPKIIQAILEVAEREKVPASQVAALLLADGLYRLGKGEIDLASFKQPSRSPRYEFNLVFKI